MRGINIMIHADVANHPMAMRGSKQMVISMNRFFRYVFGNWYPTLTSWIPMTKRVKS